MGEAEPERPFYQRPWFLAQARRPGSCQLAALIGPPKAWDVVADLISPECQ